MNEVKKTGIFWAVALVMAVVAAVVTWPTSPGERSDVDGVPIEGSLFKEFKDPLLAASLKIVTFDEEQGQLAQFEVRKDPETGNWTIPSRDGYPADAVEQMTNAANSLVDLKVLDKPTTNAEDHAKMGVIEPKLEALKIGDEGVGRLVTFKDVNQKVIASIILGDAVKDRPGQIYVREPGQDLVYVVALDDTPLTTNFQAWIEDDLLKLSSIDIDQMTVKDYSASLGQGGISLTRKYEADFAKDGTQWSLAELREFNSQDPRADAKKMELSDDDKLNTAKLTDVENALDDLTIVNVIRKPDGMSASLRADEDFLKDQDAVNSLATRGFYPVPIGKDGETEILSANGEMTVGLKDGVQYVLRFGNIARKELGTTAEGDDEDSAGVNRYLLLRTRVDEDRFPAPNLTPVPQTLEELEALNTPPQKDELNTPSKEDELPSEAEPGVDAPESAEASTETDSSSEDMKQNQDAAEPDTATEPDTAEEAKKTDAEPEMEEPAEDDSATAEPAEQNKDSGAEKADEPTEEAEAGSDDATAEADAKADSAETEQPSGETEVEGAGEASGTGQAQEDDKSEKAKADAEASDEKPTDEKPADEKPADKKPADEKPADKKDADEKPAEAKPVAEMPADTPEEDVEESDEEKQERLEAAQEKITKENQRLLDARKDAIEKARRRVRALNARFADWYYVIPEDTYTKLTIKRDDLFEKPGADSPNPAGRPPQFGMPPGGMPPGFGN